MGRAKTVNRRGTNLMRREGRRKDFLLVPSYEDKGIMNFVSLVLKGEI